MPDKQQNEKTKWITSVNYAEAGPFDIDELTLRAQNRLFTWDTYVYRFPSDDMWRLARDVPEMKNILLKHFPLKAGDTGPAGGYVIRNSLQRLVEAAPFDAGFCSWEDAKHLCNSYSLSGYSGWRLPSPDELSNCASIVSHQLRVRKSVRETDELIIHWSSQREGDNATAVVTCEIKDEYIYPYMLSYMSGISGGYWRSKNGPWCGNEIKFPVTHWYNVRPVRDIN